MSMQPHGLIAALFVAVMLLAPRGVLANPVDGIDSAALRAAVATQQARAPAPRFERAAFLLRASVTAMTLSPDGQQVAWLQGNDNDRSVWLMPSVGGTARQLSGHTTATALMWTRDSRWLLLETPQQLFALAAAGQTGSGLAATLGGTSERRFVAVHPSLPAAALLLEHQRARGGTAESWRLLRADMHGRSVVLYTDRHKIAQFAFDATGRLAFIERVEGEALVVQRIDAQGHLHPALRCTDLHRCDLLPVTDPQGRLLLETDIDGSLLRLARLDDDGSLHTLASDPRDVADLGGLMLDPVSGQPLVAAYRYPQRRLEIQAGHGAGAYWLAGENAGSLQEQRWHLYAPATGTIRDVPVAKPYDRVTGALAAWLPEAAMARKIPLTWRASDGMRLYGFLWLPPGRDPHTLPLVAMPHGGPWNHASADEFGAGYSQFLVNRGYIVFEPNFRGSTGYGRDYMFAPHGDFGNGRVQQDIVEGVRYLLGQGIGDAERVGIAGASFGGYSTLLGVTFQPQLFKVGVAIVPPPDLAWDLRWVSRSHEATASLSRYIPFKAWLRMLSLNLDDPASLARLHTQSPLSNADKMQRPLLLFASGEDHRVAIRGVTAYAAKLKLLGGDVSLFVDDQAGHQNTAPLAASAYLYLLARMLHAYLGGAAPTPPDARLRKYLHSKMRVAGSDLRDLRP